MGKLLVTGKSYSSLIKEDLDVVLALDSRSICTIIRVVHAFFKNLLPWITITIAKFFVFGWM